MVDVGGPSCDPGGRCGLLLLFFGAEVLKDAGAHLVAVGKQGFGQVPVVDADVGPVAVEQGE